MKCFGASLSGIRLAFGGSDTLSGPSPSLTPLASELINLPGAVQSILSSSIIQLNFLNIPNTSCLRQSKSVARNT